MNWAAKRVSTSGEAPHLSCIRRRTRTTQSRFLRPPPPIPPVPRTGRATPEPKAAMPEGVSESSGSRGNAANKEPSYDRRITVFSPEGRLFQVEYALNSVKLAGITSVAVRGADPVCVITQRSKAPMDPLLDTTDPAFSHLFQITERLGMLTTGMAADGRSLAQQARNEAAQYRYKWGYEMPPRMLAQWLADRAQVRTQHANMRPYSVVATIVGIDEEKGTPELYTSDPAGLVLGHKATSAGHKDFEAIKFLEENMTSNYLSFESTIEMAVSAMRHVLGDNREGYDIEVGVVRTRYPAFRTMLRRLHKYPQGGQNILDQGGR